MPGLPSFLGPTQLFSRARQRVQLPQICAAFRDNVATLPPSKGSELSLLAFSTLSARASSRDLTLYNEPGKEASFRIFSAAAEAHNGVLDVAAAREMLHIYAEIVDEARAHPGSHEMVDFLLRMVEEEDVRFVCRLDGEYY